MKKYRVEILNTKTMQVVSVFNLTNDEINSYSSTKLQDNEIMIF